MVTALQAQRYGGLHALTHPILSYPDVVVRLDAFLDRPSVLTWSDVYRIIVGGGLVTLWRSVCAVDPSFPRGLEGTWSVYPDEVTTRRALLYARRVAARVQASR